MKEKFHIFCQYWPEADGDVTDAIRENLALEDTRVHLFSVNFPSMGWDEKNLSILTIDSRITYSTFLSAVSNLIFPEDSYAILINSDIKIPQSTLKKLPNFSEKTALSVSRREADGSLPASAYGTKPDNCQDVWIVRPQVFSDSLLDTCSLIELGRPGCENRFVAELFTDGYSVYNPCNDLIFIHNTNKAVASYPDPDDTRRYNGLYAYPSPCSKYDIGQVDAQKITRFYHKIRGKW